MPTYKQLQDITIDNCQELQGITDFSREKVKYYLNRAQQDFVRKTHCLEKYFDFTTVANQEAYTLDNAVYKVHHVRYIVDPTNEFGEALQPYPGGYSALPKTRSFGTPYYYWTRYDNTRGTSEFGTFPIVPVASEVLRVWCSYYPTDMSADGDISTIKEPWHDAMMLYAVWSLHKIYSHKNPSIRQKAQDYGREYYAYVAMAIEELSEQKPAQHETVDVYCGI